MANTNCLAGMRCPECKSYGPFRIGANVMVTVHDAGIDREEDGDVDWGKYDYCYCLECDFEAEVGDFHDEEEEN